MKSVNALIADGKVEEAAALIFDGLLYLMNNYVPGVQLTKEEWDTVAPKLAEKIQKPTDPEPKEEKTEDIPGDDVEVTPSKADLVVTFKFADETEHEGVTLPNTYKRTYGVGKKYNYTVPTLEGYTAEPTSVSGTMDAKGKTQEVTYTKAGE